MTRRGVLSFFFVALAIGLGWLALFLSEVCGDDAGARKVLSVLCYGAVLLCLSIAWDFFRKGGGPIE